MLTKKKFNKDYKTSNWFVKKSEGLYIAERGWGNGYAIVPKGNHLYGKSTSEVHAMLSKRSDIKLYSEITFSGTMNYEGKQYSSIGFDTNHFGDTIEKWPKEKVEEYARKLASVVIGYNY